MGKIETDHTGSGGGITLSSDGTSLLLDGTAVGGGDFVHISTATITSSTASVEIGLPSGYDKFYILFDLWSTLKSGLYMQFSQDNGVSYMVSQYTMSQQNGSFSANLSWTSATYSGVICPDRGKFLQGNITILNASASTNTVFQSTSSNFAGGGGDTTAIAMSASGMSTSQSARINKIKMLGTGSYVWNTGKISLYGIKES